MSIRFLGLDVTDALCRTPPKSICKHVSLHVKIVLAITKAIWTKKSASKKTFKTNISINN